VNPSPDDLWHVSLLLSRGLPLLAAVMISYHFVTHYLHKRAEEMSAIAKFAYTSRKRGPCEVPKGTPETRTCGEQAGRRDKSPVSTEARGKAGANTSQRRSGSLAPIAPAAQSSGKGEPKAPPTSIVFRR
jgi:hypothetical protein